MVERFDETMVPEQSFRCSLSYGSPEAVLQWRDTFVERLKEQKLMLNRFDEFGTTGFGESMSDILMSTRLKNELNRAKEITKKVKGKMLYRKNIMTRFVQEVSKLNEGNICVDGDPVYKLYIEEDLRLKDVLNKDTVLARKASEFVRNAEEYRRTTMLSLGIDGFEWLSDVPVETPRAAVEARRIKWLSKTRRAESRSRSRSSQCSNAYADWEKV